MATCENASYAIERCGAERGRPKSGRVRVDELRACVRRVKSRQSGPLPVRGRRRLDCASRRHASVPRGWRAARVLAFNHITAAYESTNRALRDGAAAAAVRHDVALDCLRTFDVGARQRTWSVASCATTVRSSMREEECVDEAKRSAVDMRFAMTRPSPPSFSFSRRPTPTTWAPHQSRCRRQWRTSATEL